MSRNLTVITTIFFVFLALAILGGMVWGNTLFARDHPGEKDFLVPWLAARTFLDYGNSPYGNPAAQRAQIVYYGRVAAEGEDLLILWLPFPAELFYFPFALIPDYALARGLWMTLCEAALVASAFVALRLTGWKLSRFLLPLALLFPVLWIFGFMNLLAASPVPFVVLASVGALLALRSGQDEVAGALLVMPLLKIGIFGIFLLFVFWWSIYHRRWRVLAGLSMALGILLLLSFLLLSDWIMPFVRGLYWHVIHNPGLSFYQVLGSIWPVVGPRLGWALTALLLVMLFVEWREVCYKDFRHTLWTACLTLAITPLLGFPLAVNDFAILVLPLFLIATILGERWPGRRLRGPAGIVLLAAWIALWRLALAPGLAPLLPILLVIGLYWIKWWAVRPPRTALESLP